MNRPLLISALALALSACSNAPIAPPGAGHLSAEKVGPGNTASIPAPVQQVAALPKPKVAPKVETYSVVVNSVKVQELLFALARDAKLNVDIHPGIDGLVTLNAIDQTLQQLLTRIAKQVDIRWELDGPNLAVMPDSPFLRTYKVDYVNMSRDSTSTVTVSSQITTQGTAGAAGTNANNSKSDITNITKNHFWTTLADNITNILNEEGETIWERKCNETSVAARNSSETNSGSRSNTTIVPAAGPAVATNGPGNESAQRQSGGAASSETSCGKYVPKGKVMANAEAGVISVRATARQHEKVREFLDQVMVSAKRQVLIEATVVEVELSDTYKQGISWDKVTAGLATAGITTAAGNTLSQILSGNFILNTVSGGNTFQATINLLNSYGNVKVLSSPKLSVLNNQTAVMRVVTNNVYFTVKSDVAAGVSGSAPVKAITTTPNTVAVGFVMSVTPQISDNDTITLNVRPSITSTVGDGVKDPNPDLTINSYIPVIRTREMESILRINSGNMAVMGGLMEDRLDNVDTGLPAVSGIPIFGNIFQNRNDLRKKTELVIFLRPVIIKDASLEGDYAAYRNLLPSKDFFDKGNIGPAQQRLDFGGKAQ